MSYVLIVDGFSAGNLLAPEFKSRGLKTLHVQTTETIWPIVLPTFRPDDYEALFTYRGNVAQLLEELSPYRIGCVLPGTETGVELADTLAQALGVPNNGTALSEARRNKYLMVEACRAAGLEVAQQVRSSKLEEVLQWRRAHGLERVVLKPLKSAGTDSVSICSTENEIRKGFEAIFGTTNKIGIENTEVLAQEFLEGTEYFLNTVSNRGVHHFTEIWQYQKRSINGHSFVYDCNKLLPHDGEIPKALREYVSKVVTALGISYGPAHTEVILTSKGPRLVESGARLDGLSVPAVNTACIGYGPLDLTADLFSEPDTYLAKTSVPYPLLKHARTVYLTSYEEGTVRGIPGEETLRALPSFFQMRLRVKPGSPVKKTIDYFTAPGFLTLVHESAQVVEADYQRIREMEEKGWMFEIQASRLDAIGSARARQREAEAGPRV